MPHTFPQSFNAPRLGPLHLNVHNLELPDHEPLISRHYRAERPQPIRGRADVELIVWPPKAGVPDPAALASLIERCWDAITTNLDAILKAAEPTLWASVLEFSDPCVEGWPPDAATLLRTARLQSVRINSCAHADDQDNDACHELIFNLIGYLGEHDLNLGLNHNVEPIYAHFDG